MSVKTFLVQLERRGLRESTILSYTQRLSFVLSQVIPFTEQHFEDFLLTLKRSGVKATTLNKYIDIVNHYTQFEGACWNLQFFKEEKAAKGIFSDAEIDAIITLPKPKGFRTDVWNRWTLWLQILAYSGMRASECSSLTPSQVDFGTNNFILDHTKTEPRNVPISPLLVPLLQEYIPTCTTYLFPSPTKRGHVWRQGWHKHLSIRMKLLGIKRKNLTTHSFRHSFIMNLIGQNVPLPVVMGIVGHKRLETTQQYVHLNNKMAQDGMQQHSHVKRTLEPKDLLAYFIKEAEKQGLLDSNKFHYIIENDFFAIWEKGKKEKKISFTDT